MTIHLTRVGRVIAVASATTIVLLLSGAAYAVGQSADDESAIPAAQVRIAATSNGSGCPGGTADVKVLSNNGGFTVTYRDEYLARVGGGADPTDIRKNCQVNVQIDVPNGFSYAIASAQHNGLASLLAGAVGLQRWSQYFQGNSNTGAFDHRFVGPFRNSWQTNDQLTPGQLMWSPCNEQRNINVNTELRVTAGASPRDTTSYMRADSSDNDVDAAYRFTWRRCA
jgi:hypothetical protein